MSDDMANRRQRRRHRQDWYAARILVGGRLVAPLGEDYHGKTATYDYYGCRCDLCARAAQQRRRARAGNRRVTSPEAESTVEHVEVVNTAPTRLTHQQCSEQHAPSESKPVQPDDPWPQFMPGARDALVTVSEGQHVLDAYYRPQWSCSAFGDGTMERRAAHGLVLTVNRHSGTVLHVESYEQDDGTAPETLREVKTPKRRKGGKGAKGLPSTYSEVIDRLKEMGCTVDTGAKHLKVTLPDGRTRSLPKSASDWRSIRNTVAQFRADGLDLRRNSA